jgi:hypothetical protein
MVKVCVISLNTATGATWSVAVSDARCPVVCRTGTGAVYPTGAVQKYYESRVCYFIE